MSGRPWYADHEQIRFLVTLEQIHIFSQIDRNITPKMVVAGLAEWLTPDMVAEQRKTLPGQPSPGRPRGPRYFRDKADFEARLIQIIDYMDKHQYPIGKETIACTLRLLLKTQPQINNISRAVEQADHEHNESKTAAENLRRWCKHYVIDLDQLIRRVKES
jgi:hypothetical protein